MGFILGTINAMILITLSGLHFFWATGGTWGFDNALPTTKEGNRILNPKKLDCGIIAIGLLIFAFLFMIRIDLLEIELQPQILTYSIWIIIAIFIVRSIGDFRYVGFTKKLTDTNFAELDSKLYSPLCLAIGLIGLIVHLS